MLLALATAWAGSAGAQTPVDDLALAIVYGEKITRRQLVDRVVDYFGELTRERMINRRLIELAAAKAKISVTPEEVEQRYAAIRSQFRSEADLKAFLERNHLTEERYRDEIADTMLLRKVALAASPVSDDELQQYHVRLLTASEEATIEKWLKQLKAGVPFLKLVKEESTDPALKQVDGRMKPFLKIEMYDLGQAIVDQKLKPGQYTRKPIKLGSGGWALLLLEGITVVSQASMVERERLTQFVARYHIDQWLEQQKKAAKIELKPLTESVIAVVNGSPVQRSELERRLLAAYGEESLELMINRLLLLRAAAGSKVTVTDAEAAQKMAEVRARFGSAEEYQAFLTGSNLGEAQLRDEVRYNTLMERVALAENPIVPEDLMRYDIRLLVAPTREAAARWASELDAGADFGRMASERSVDPNGKLSAGRMKPFLRTEALELWRIIDSQKLQPGEFSKTPVLLSDGTWVLLKLENKLTADGLAPDERKKLTAAVADYRTGQWLRQTLQRAEEGGQIKRPVPVSAVLAQK